MRSVDEIRLEKLVKLSKAGNAKAFHELYEKTWLAVYYNIVKKVDSEEDARDLVQEIYIKVFKSIKNINADVAFLSYLNKIAHNEYANYIRKKSTTIDTENLDDMEYEIYDTDEEFLPEVVLEKQELRSEVLTIVNSLPPLQRDAILMFYYQQMTTKEIAYSENVKENIVCKRLHDARKTIKAKFEQLIAEGEQKL